jgi:isopenicillin-N N-acyltransferase-like protein
LYVPGRDGRLPYSVWGLLAQHCGSVDDVMQLTRDYGCTRSFHCTVADEHGGIVGIEYGKGGPAFLKPRRGIYVHANAVVRHRRMQRYESAPALFPREDSLHREARLRARLEADRGRLTAPLAFAALQDHDGYPRSVCRHQGPRAQTTAAVVVEPARGLLHVCRGQPCRNLPVTYTLPRGLCFGKR